MFAEDCLNVEAGYSLWASLYDDDGNPLVAIEGPAVAEAIGARDLAGRRVVDLGCGTGRHTRTLIKAGAVVVAADLTTAMLDRARAKLDGRGVGWLRLSLPGPLPFADGSFALAVLGLVVEHVEAIGPTFAEVARILEPGGLCVVTALHPERTAEGQSARFIDPETGERRPIQTIHREAEETLSAAASAGLRLVEERTLVVPPELGEALPRARPYVGRALGWLAVWERPALTSPPA